MKHNFDELWTTRALALDRIRRELEAEANLLVRIFALIDQCIDDYEKFFVAKTPLASVAAVTSAKGRNLALGCLSLVIDGLGQEAGALFRPLLETIELLTYLRESPDAVAQVVEGRLPKPGKIAEKIDGKFKELREYLNAHASHMSASYEALHHLVANETGKLHKVQPLRPDVLRTNLAQLFAFISILAGESAALLRECSKTTGAAPISTESLLRKVHACHMEARQLFLPTEGDQKSIQLRLPSSLPEES